MDAAWERYAMCESALIVYMADIPSKLYQSGTDNKATHIRLKRGVIFPETAEFIFTVQAKVIPTGNYLKYISKTPTSYVTHVGLVALHRKISNVLLPHVQN